MLILIMKRQSVHQLLSSIKYRLQILLLMQITNRICVMKFLYLTQEILSFLVRLAHLHDGARTLLVLVRPPARASGPHPQAAALLS